MKWYQYIACFFLGAFLVNSIPHFVHGISGDSFPTPFADPPGKGLSSPLLNVLWGLFNIIVSLLLYKASKITTKNKWAIILFAIGFIAMSINLSYAFINKGLV
jgi:hypothetical protein